MSTDPGPPAAPTGTPWTVDALADLHAGLHPADVRANLRQQISGDQDAAAVLAALDSVVDSLSRLPSPRMPEHVALRLDAALAAESAARTARRTGQIRAPQTPVQIPAQQTSGPMQARQIPGHIPAQQVPADELPTPVGNRESDAGPA